VQGIAFHSFTANRKIKLSEYNWNAIRVMKQLLGVAAGAGPSLLAASLPPKAPSQSVSVSAPHSNSSPDDSDASSDVNSAENAASGESAPSGTMIAVDTTATGGSATAARLKSSCAVELPMGANSSAGAAMGDPSDLLQLVSDDFNVSAFNMQVEGHMAGGVKPGSRRRAQMGGAGVVKQEPGQPQELPSSSQDAVDFDEEYAQGKAEYLAVSRRGFFGQAGPVHGSKVCLRFLEYQCGYCGERKISTSAGGDGRVRIRCECGGKHADNQPRMHAKWKMCTDTPLPPDTEDVEGIAMGAMVGGRPFTNPKRAALAASAPY